MRIILEKLKKYDIVVVAGKVGAGPFPHGWQLKLPHHRKALATIVKGYYCMTSYPNSRGRQ
jgi:hypothetical protein